jgi:hypothetical protein
MLRAAGKLLPGSNSDVIGGQKCGVAFVKKATPANSQHVFSHATSLSD